MNKMDKLVKDVNFRANNTGKKYYKDENLTPKQSKLLLLYLSGMNKNDALLASGYHPTNCLVWNKLQPIIDKIQKDKIEEIKKCAVSKEDIIATLKNIMDTDDDNRTKIWAIDKLIKVYGFEAPTKVDSTVTTNQPLFIIQPVLETKNEAN